MTRRATILGFAVAPLAVPVAVTISFLGGYVLQAGWFRGKSFALVAGSAWGFAAVACAAAYAVALILGIPAYVIARRRGWLSFAQSIAIGIIVALLPLTALFAVWVLQEPALIATAFRQGVTWVLLFAMCGGSSGAAFWIIALRRERPA